MQALRLEVNKEIKHSAIKKLLFRGVKLTEMFKNNHRTKVKIGKYFNRVYTIYNKK